MIDAMNEKVVQSMFETLPVEITVIDGNDKVIGWNRHRNRLFYRPMECMGMDFRECHPAESLHLVERIVGEMKQGTRSKARFWIDLTVNRETHERHKVLIEFYALRDETGKYLGCMESTLDVEEIMHLTGEKRLIDEP
jgi:uncharacterized protein